MGRRLSGFGGGGFDVNADQARGYGKCSVKRCVMFFFSRGKEALWVWNGVSMSTPTRQAREGVECDDKIYFIFLLFSWQGGFLGLAWGFDVSADQAREGVECDERRNVFVVGKEEVFC